MSSNSAIKPVQSIAPWSQEMYTGLFFTSSSECFAIKVSEMGGWYSVTLLKQHELNKCRKDSRSPFHDFFGVHCHKTAGKGLCLYEDGFLYTVLWQQNDIKPGARNRR